jgi:hypothetical protein
VRPGDASSVRFFYRCGLTSNVRRHDPQGFLEMCKKTDNNENTSIKAATNEGYCFGWTYGFVEGVLSDPHKPMMCLPQYRDTLSAVFVIKKYIQDHPEKQNLETPVLARAALMSEYPCK